MQRSRATIHFFISALVRGASGSRGRSRRARQRDRRRAAAATGTPGGIIVFEERSTTLVELPAGTTPPSPALAGRCCAPTSAMSPTSPRLSELSPHRNPRPHPGSRSFIPTKGQHRQRSAGSRAALHPGAGERHNLCLCSAAPTTPSSAASCPQTAASLTKAVKRLTFISGGSGALRFCARPPGDLLGQLLGDFLRSALYRPADGPRSRARATVETVRRTFPSPLANSAATRTAILGTLSGLVAARSHSRPWRSVRGRGGAPALGRRTSISSARAARTWHSGPLGAVLTRWRDLHHPAAQLPVARNRFMVRSTASRVVR